MANFSSDAIRNICLLGHGGDGKTSIAEAMLYLAKATDRLGKIADGNTVCDFDPEEIKRGFSLSASLAHFEWKGKKINLLDTPGYFDFAGGAIIVLEAKGGVKVGAELAWDAAASIPKAFFVNKDGRRERRLRYGVPIPAREIRQERLPGHRALRKGRGGGIL